MILRKIGDAALGKATPTQTVLATALGGMLGFVPSVFLLGFGGAFSQSPGLLVTLMFLVLILNANLAIFGVALVAAKALGLLLLPLSFAFGRFLLDGPTGPLFEVLINAPVLAWFGFEYYATTGALLLGLAFGIVVGLLLVGVHRRLLARLADLETDSERYQKWASKKSVRFLTWLLLGVKRGKKTWREQADDRRRGSPVRIVGVVVALLLAVGLVVAQTFLTSSAFRSIARSSLETFNGATVDLANAVVDLAGGKIEIDGLAMANAEALETNVFDARTLELQIGTKDLLERRFVVEEVASREAASGTKRVAPGQRIHKTPAPPPPPPKGDEKTLDDYLKDAEVWKDRLQRIGSVVERLFGPGETDAGKPQTRDAGIEDQIELLGMARTAASHLIAGAPVLLVRKLIFEGVEAKQLGLKLDVHGENLSTNPRLVKDPAKLSIRSRDERVVVAFAATGSGGLTVQLAWKGIPSATIATLLASSPLRGGTVDLELDGVLDRSRPGGLWLDLPLRITLHDTMLKLPGMPETAITALTIPLGLRGPLASPRISLDDAKLADALVAAGKQELAKQVRSRLDAALGGKVPGAGGQLGDLIEGKKTPQQLLDEAKKQAEEKAKQKAAEELKKALPGGLFGGKKNEKK